MKKIIYSLLTMVVLFSISCNNEESFDTIDNNALYEKVLKSENQIKSFNELSDLEKIEVWKTKYDLMLSTYNLTTSQITFINKLKNELSNISPQNKSNMKSMSYNLYKESLTHFSKKESQYLLFQLENYKDGDTSIEKEFWGWYVEITGPCGWYWTGNTYEWCAPATYTHYAFWVQTKSFSWFVGCQ